MGIFTNYKEQSAELKKLKKERKLLQKKNRNNDLYKAKLISTIIFSILLIFAFTISPILSLLSNLSNSQFKDFGDFTDDYIAELNKPVNVDNLIKYNRISTENYTSAYNTFTTHGIDIFNEDKTVNSTKLNNFTKVIRNNISLTAEELGAFLNAVMVSTDATNIEINDTSTPVVVNNIEILELSLYNENDSTYIYSVLKLPLNDLLNRTDLPVVYVSTSSKISIQNGVINTSDYSTKLNEIDTTMNDNILAIISILLNSANIKASNFNTDIILALYSTISKNLHAEINLNNNLFTLTPKQY